MSNVSNPTTWNPADTFAGTLDGSYLTFTANAGNSHAMIRANRGYNSGKRYFEVAFNGIGVVFNCCAGITTHAATPTNIEATGLHAALIMHYGFGNQAQANGSSLWQNALGSYIGVCGFAVDLDANLMWMRPTPTDSWNNSGSADPATGVGGIDISFFGSTLVTPFAQGHNSAGEPNWVLNAGQTTFAGAVPTGFTAGWDEPVIPLGFSGGIFPGGTYRVLFSQTNQLDDTSGPALSDIGGTGFGGHPSLHKLYFGFPDPGAHLYVTEIVIFDTNAILVGGVALQEWTVHVDGADISDTLVYDGIGTATATVTVAEGMHYLELVNVVQASAGGTYQGHAISNTYKTDVITIGVDSTGLVPTTSTQKVILTWNGKKAWPPV